MFALCAPSDHLQVASQSKCASLSLRAPILDLSVSDNYAACAMGDGSVVLLTLSPLRQLFRFDAHSAATTAVHLVTASQLITGSLDGEACLWRLDEVCTATLRRWVPA